MKFVSYFLGAVLLASVKGQATDCDYDYVCDDTGSPGDLVMAAPTPRACYEACRDSVDAGSGTSNCDFWTYYEELGFKTYGEDNGTVLDGAERKVKATGIPVCRRLTSCDTKFALSRWCDPALGKQKCASGPGNCEACAICDPLDYLPGTAISHWSCDRDMPYQMTNGMPSLSICRTECPSTEWSDNFIMAECQSDCPGGAKGNWVLTAPNGGTIDGAGTTVHPGPTLDAACPCTDIVLGKDQVPDSDGITMEDGARFYCDAGKELVDTGSGTGIADTMQSTSSCQLYCNNHLTMDIYCQAGAWTDGVTASDDIYCFGAPKDCLYNPGVNTEVCTCSNLAGDTTAHCAEGEACNVGVCEPACVESVDPIAGADCFCQGASGGAPGETCIVGKTCDNYTCV